MSRPRRRSAALVAAVAVVAAGALLTMHFSTAGHDGPTVSRHDGSLSALAGPTLTAGASDSSTGDHAHGLVECCFALLLGGMVLFVAVRSSRIGVVAQLTRTLTDRSGATSQRAPPLTMRLSLVGVSRR